MRGGMESGLTHHTLRRKSRLQRMILKKPVPDFIRDGNRYSDWIMRP